MPRQIIKFKIEIKAGDTQHYHMGSWTAHHKARRSFMEELMELVENHAKNNHLVISSTHTAHSHEVDYG